MKNKNLQISTAIDYPSGKFHLGHAYEKIFTDVIARWKALNGYNVHFSTGTDCHGLKIERAAEKSKKSPKEFVNEISNGFRELCDVLNISNNDFIMTIEERHKKVVLEILKKLETNKDLYKGDYEGLYCVDCETYYTEKDSEDGNCPIHKIPLELIRESSYFFKLSKYQNMLIDEINKKDLIWPKKKKKEILNRLKEPLRDLSISRKKVEWGIPFPFEKGFTVFVWVEALINYLTTIDYPNKKFKDYWPAVHVIGSEIVWHHTAIWFSILKSLGIELPKVVVHGFINLKGEKLSKARGIVVDPIDLAKKYSADSLRYFLMRNIVSGEDGDFDEAALIERHNNELLNKLGNLVSRTAGLIEKHGIEKCENSLNIDIEKIKSLIEKFEFDKALNEIFAFIDRCNEYVQHKKPWETKDKKVFYELADAIKNITILLSPFMPQSSEKIAKQFNFKITLKQLNTQLSEKSKIKKGYHIFARIETKSDNSKQPKVNKELKIKEIVEGVAELKFEDWMKVDLRVGQIKTIEDIEGADKLYKLSVNLGSEERTIVSGLKEYYTNDQLQDMKIIVISNLAPRKMRGVMSEGMLLAAVTDDEKKVVLIGPTADIKNGTKIS